jgi:hypothetical protein
MTFCGEIQCEEVYDDLVVHIPIEQHVIYVGPRLLMVAAYLDGKFVGMTGCNVQAKLLIEKNMAEITGVTRYGETTIYLELDEGCQWLEAQHE